MFIVTFIFLKLRPYDAIQMILLLLLLLLLLLVANDETIDCFTTGTSFSTTSITGSC